MSAHLAECDGQCGDVCQDRYYATLFGAPRVTLPLDPPPYVPVPIAPDAARDVRVAARRAADARKAGGALDRLLLRDVATRAYDRGFEEGYAASELQHNRAYVPPDVATDGLHLAGVDEDHSPDACRVLGGHRCPRCQEKLGYICPPGCPLHHNAHYVAVPDGPGAVRLVPDMGPKCKHGYWADGQACQQGCTEPAPEDR